jgi:hypothetical protein
MIHLFKVVIVSIVALLSINAFSLGPWGSLKRLTGVARGMVRYDAFESDPALKARLSEALKGLVKANDASSSLQAELREKSLPYKDLVDKQELQRRVAMVRVKQQLAHEKYAMNEEDGKTERVQGILAEMESIEPMDTGQIVNELYERAVAFKKPVERADVMRTLALARLGVVQPHVETTPAAKKGGGGDELLGVRGALWQSYRRRGEVLYTKAEKAALDGLNINSQRARSSSASASASSSSSSRGVSKWEITDLDRLSTFDDICEWVSAQDVAQQQELCELYGVSVEEEAAAAAAGDFGALVADAVLTMRTQGRLEKESPLTHSKPFDRDYNVLNPEAELLRDLNDVVRVVANKTQQTASRLVESAFSEETATSIADGIGKVTQSTLNTGGRSALSGVLLMAMTMVKTLAQWAVGSHSPAAGQACFAAAAICVIFRRGVVSFLGILVAIRVFRGSSRSGREGGSVPESSSRLGAVLGRSFGPGNEYETPVMSVVSVPA